MLGHSQERGIREAGHHNKVLTATFNQGDHQISTGADKGGDKELSPSTAKYGGVQDMIQQRQGIINAASHMLSRNQKPLGKI